MLHFRIRMYRKLAAQFWLWPLLFVLVMRALIPAGYMPGQDVQEHGFGFDLCIGSDRSTQEVFENWLAQNRDPAQSEAAGTPPCAFCVLAHLSADLPPLAAVASIPFFFLVVALLPDHAPVILTEQGTGPPLGSRAPPFFL